MIGLLDFLASHRAEVLARLGEHVVLVAVSTLGAAIIGVPLGVLAARRPALARPLVGLANVAQTIPSLALFGFLIPLPFVGGIGIRTAIVALTLYAVLPIVRTTIAGLQSVDRSVLECAVAMGMTPVQVFRHIELPLAAPGILAGVRVATVVGVGTATIASAIGAGGLGDYIFRGLAMVDPIVILSGALPAAMLALSADGLLVLVGRALDPRRRSRRAPATAIAGGLAASLVVGVMAWVGSADAAIVVGSKNFTEQVLLGELLAQAVERHTGLRVERRLNLGGTLVCDEALRSGDIDVYVEYTGTALTALFDEPLESLSGATSPKPSRMTIGGRGASASAEMSDISGRVLGRVRELYAGRSVTLLPPLGFNNTFAILVRGKDARAHGLSRISDLTSLASGWRAGFGYEFLERPDGYRGLINAYDLPFRASPRVMDLNLIYRAVAAGEIDVTAGDATSGLIDALGLVVLEDDLQYFPPYDAVPVARSSSLLRFPEVGAAIRGLAGRISAPDMRRMNHEVDGRRRDPADVARAFLDDLDSSGGSNRPLP